MLETQSDVEVSGFADALRTACLRLVANRWLSLSLISFNSILIGLIIALAILSNGRPVLLVAAAAGILALAGCAIFVWHTRPTSYDIAQRLDTASRLGDRISTAIHFCATTSPSDVVLRQRQDALEHLAKVHPDDLFPYRMPAKTWRTAALLAAFAVVYAYHSAYGPAIPRLGEKASQSHAAASLLSPLSRALDLARGEKKEFADLIASNDRDHSAATENQKPLSLPTAGQPDAAAKAVEKSPAFDMVQDLQMANTGSTSMTQGAATPLTPGQQAAMPSNTQSGTPADQQQAGQQQGQAGQQSLAEKALQALANLMGTSGTSGQQNNSNGTPPPSLSSAPTAGATSTQSTSGNSQAASTAAQAAQGQTSNSNTPQNQSLANSGKHTGAGNGSSPWQPHAAQDAQLAGNTAKEHVQLQSTGYRGEPGKERSDVAPGTAQIPLQNVAPQTVTTINGAGQDSVPPRYRQYVQNYFQHSGK